MKYFRISELDLRELLAAAHLSWSLESWGVDNWIGWGEAQNNYVEEYNHASGTAYEDIEEIVETELCDYPICTCKEQPSTFNELMKNLP